MNKKVVSIIMSVYNGEKYLSEAIESMLNQTLKDFEFIIINDGSTDNSLKILEEYRKKDNRIIIKNNNINKGLIYSLNKGLELAQGKYIARMDADDISEKNRLEEQVNFLEKNKDIVMCSTYVKMFKNNLKFLTKKFRTETDFEKIKIKLLFRNYIAHPTIMIRKETIEKYNIKYKIEDKGMEDYGLWLFLVKNEKIVTIPKYLLKYRFLSNSISSKALERLNKHKENIENIYRRELEVYNLSKEEYKIHTEIALMNNLENYNYQVNEKIEYLDKLLILLGDKDFNKKYLKNEIERQKIDLILNQSSFIDLILKKNQMNLLYRFIKVRLIRMIKKIVR